MTIGKERRCYEKDSRGSPCSLIALLSRLDDDVRARAHQRRRGYRLAIGRECREDDLRSVVIEEVSPDSLRCLSGISEQHEAKSSLTARKCCADSSRPRRHPPSPCSDACLSASRTSSPTSGTRATPTDAPTAADPNESKRTMETTSLISCTHAGRTRIIWVV